MKNLSEFRFFESDKPLAELLPPPWREAFLKAELTAGNYTALAAELGIPLNTFKTRVHRARRRILKLREEMRQRAQPKLSPAIPD